MVFRTPEGRSNRGCGLRRASARPGGTYVGGKGRSNSGAASTYASSFPIVRLGRRRRSSGSGVTRPPIISGGMAENALYFPYIEVPDSADFTRLLLYWRSVGSIIPTAARRSEPASCERMRSLIDAGLVRPIDPSAVASPDLNERFVDLIDGWLARRPPSDRPARPIRVHTGKGSDWLWKELRHRALARERKTSRWIDVDGRVAAAYLMALASDICKYRDDIEPVTDQVHSSRSAPVPQKGRRPTSCSMRCVVLFSRDSCLRPIVLCRLRSWWRSNRTRALNSTSFVPRRARFARGRGCADA